MLGWNGRAHECRELCRITERRQRVEILTVVGRQRTYLGAAEPVRLVEDRLEHRREVAGGGIDYLQYFGGRSLLP